jgi:UDP-N-acetylmuramyl pentapeptide synthase
MGARARHLAAGAREAEVDHVVETDDPMTAARVVASWTDPDDWVVIKASRGMRLERVADALKEVVG